MTSKDRGFIHISLLVIAIIIVACLILFSSIKNVSQNFSVPTTSSPSLSTEPPSPFPTETPTPTPIPTPIPTASPKPTVTPTKSPAPTAKPVSGPPGAGYSHLTVATEIGNFIADIVSIDLSNGAHMITDTASDNDCPSNCPVLPLADYVSRNGAFAGINGTYFCPADYADCASKKNSFDFPVYNSRLNKWVNQGNLFWNDRSLVYRDGSGMHFMRDAKTFGGGLLAGIVNSPGLLDNGNIIADQFPLSDKQKTRGSKGGIGIRGNVVYLVIGRSVTMFEFAHIFKSLGANYALNLDGGGSSALWYDGYKVGPGRNLPNAVLFSR